ncbi:MAG: DNA repair protein RecO [Actinomycetota bacterium]|nr:DNA repair protein RecO [Actinomycetota bacterium]
MPGLYKDEAIVLKAIKLGEADRILTLFTRHNGKVSAVAKGIRKTKSRFGGRLEPFTRVHLLVYRGRSLDTITGADILQSFKQVRDDYHSLASASSIAELVDKVTPERERLTSVYSLLLGSLESLAGLREASILPAFYLKLLSISGYHPQLAVCAGCGSSDLYGFSAAVGGAVCELCYHEDPDAARIPSHYLDLLRRLLVADFGERADPDDAIGVTRVLRRYAEYHLERPLRSLEVPSN